MKRYYAIVTEETGLLAEVGTNKKNLEAKIKTMEEGAYIVNLAEEAYQHKLEWMDESDQALYIDDLKEEYDSRINSRVFYLGLPELTVGRFKKFLEAAKVSDDAPLSIFDPDTRASKSIIDCFMNGPYVEFLAETWGRETLKNLMP